MMMIALLLMTDYAENFCQQVLAASITLLQEHACKLTRNVAKALWSFKQHTQKC